MDKVEDLNSPVIVNNYVGQIFEIGKPFERGRVIYPEGIQFDFSELGATLIMTMANPTPAEINNISSGPIFLSLIPIDEILFVLCKFGFGAPWLEAPFNINLSQLRTLSDLKEPIDNCGYQLITFLVDAATGILRGTRQTGLSNEFSVEFRNAVIFQNGMAFDKEKYNRKIDRIWQENKQGELLKRSYKIYSFYMGKWTVNVK
jgi:hypothetical protein